MSQRKSIFSTRLLVWSESATQDSDSPTCVESQDSYTQQTNFIGCDDEVYRPCSPTAFETGNTEEVLAWMCDIPTIPSFVYDPNIVTLSPLVSHGHLDQTPHNGGEETPHNGGEEHYDDLQDAQGLETVCTPDGIDSPHA